MSLSDVIRLLADILSAGSLPPALIPLAVMYPSRQIQGNELADGLYELRVFYRYKKHSAHLFVDADSARESLQSLLPDNLLIRSFRDEGNYIQLLIEGV